MDLGVVYPECTYAGSLLGIVKHVFSVRMDNESFYEGFPMIFSQSAITMRHPTVLPVSPVWEPILSRKLHPILYVSYFFETFSFLFRKTRRKFYDPLALSKRLRRSNPKSTENS